MLNWLGAGYMTIERDDDEICLAVPECEIDLNDPIRFSVQRASGGVVVQTSYYNNQKDKRTQNLHVIPEGKDVAEAIGKIVTYEFLKV